MMWEVLHKPHYDRAPEFQVAVHRINALALVYFKVICAMQSLLH